MNLLRQLRVLFAVGLVLATAGVVHASGASFVISAEAGGPALGKPTDGEIPQYSLKMEVGQTVVLTAQGMVMPRGAAPSPGEADAAAWLFDDALFQLAPLDKAKADKTKTTVALKALKEGKTRVRFVGNILGYERKYDVMVEIIAAKK
jgi:hypothetical protein